MYKYLISLLFAFSALAVGAENVTVSAGQLSEAIKNPKNVTQLAVSGEINAADLSFIDSELSALQSLDLSKATIVASEGTRVGLNTNFREKTIPANMFAGARFTSIVLPESVGLVIETGAFAGSALESITIPGNTYSVGEGAFANCPNLKSATIKSNVLEPSVFSECDALESVTFTVSMVVPDGCFYSCSNLATVNGSELVRSIGARAFSGCKSLTDFTFSARLNLLGERAFEYSGLSSAYLDQSTRLKEVGAWSFANMPNLTTIDLGNVNTMGEGVVFNCPKLHSFSAKNVTEIPAYAYAKDAVIDSIGVLPEGVVSVGAYAMSDITGMDKITLPKSLEYLDSHAMQRMTGLSMIYAHCENVPELGDDVWSGINQSTVKVAAVPALLEVYRDTPQWQKFQVIGMDPGDITGVEAAVSSQISLVARFVGYELQVQADGIEISELGLYDTNGARLLFTRPVNGYVAIDTSDIQGNIFIVAATLADGRQASVKLVR